MLKGAIDLEDPQFAEKLAFQDKLIDAFKQSGLLVYYEHSKPRKDKVKTAASIIDEKLSKRKIRNTTKYLTITRK